MQQIELGNEPFTFRIKDAHNVYLNIGNQH